MVDLGCGNAYLTFAAHAWLRERMPVRLVGVDVKEQSRRHNTEVAERLGVADELTFVAAGIRDVVLEDPPDVVLALHACDTATDDALAPSGRLGGRSGPSSTVLPSRYFRTITPNSDTGGLHQFDPRRDFARDDWPTP